MSDSGLYLEKSLYKVDDSLNLGLFLEYERSEDKKGVVDKIVRNNLPLINYTIRTKCGEITETCQRTRITYDDLFSVGSIGLMEAISGFDPHRGIKFSTYAVSVIFNRLRSWDRANTRHSKHGSMSDPIPTSEDESLCFEDAISDSRNYEEEIVEKEYFRILVRELRKVLNTKELGILKYYFQHSMKQTQIAKLIGVSRPHTSRLLNDLLKKAKDLDKRLLREAR